ncbi:MAG TPA: hypothetical protein VNO30_20645 [Kofleriaceae bacterium]|nr:hypothetical protein [Kofleriaceae bacterium]
MRIASFALIAALVACGGKSKPAQYAPLPDDKPATPAAPAAPAPDAAAKAPEVPPPPPEPAGPLEVKIPAQQTAVKLVGKGTGKLAPVRYSGKAGGKQQVELALDFATTQTLGADTQDTVLPTIVLVGEAETKAVDKDGRADYAITVRGTDARAVPSSRLKPEELKEMLGSIAGLVIGGSVAANGAAGDLTLRLEKPDRMSGGAIEMIRLTLPVLPVLPAEPIGVGAKWQTTTTTTLAEKIAVTHVTDYELVATKGNTWSIKGKTTVTGADQELGGGKISKIQGTGTSELTLATGALYPTYKSSLETKFTASEKDASMILAFRVGGAITTK